MGDFADERDVDDGQKRGAGSRDKTQRRVEALFLADSRHLRPATGTCLFILNLR